MSGDEENNRHAICNDYKHLSEIRADMIVEAEKIKRSAEHIGLFLDDLFRRHEVCKECPHKIKQGG